jgi:hypothetical protein
MIYTSHFATQNKSNYQNEELLEYGKLSSVCLHEWKRIKLIKNRLHSRKRKRRRRMGNHKRRTEQLKSMEKQKGDREKQETGCSSSPDFPKTQPQGKPSSPGDRLAYPAMGCVHISHKPLTLCVDFVWQ